MQANVAIIVDHPLRDLGGCTLIAQALAQRGARVCLVPMNLMNGELLALQPDFVLLNYLRPNNLALAERLLAAGMVVGILDTEGGLYTNLEIYKRLFPQSPVLRQIALYCSWGQKVADYLIAEKIFTPEQVVITGLPRFDYYAPQAPQKNGSPARPLVMINTKVSLANPGFNSVEREKEVYLKKLGFSAQDVARMLTLGFANIRETLAMANRLAADFPGVDFVLRPHPHERLATYQEGIDPGLSNLQVNQTGSIDEWIPQCRAVIHRSCTTAIEAVLAGVPALNASWIPSAAEAADCDAVSVDCRDYTALHTTLTRVLSQPQSVELPRAIIAQMVADWFYRIDGNAHARVADAIWRLLPSSRAINAEACRRYLLRLDEPWHDRRGAVARLVRLLRALVPERLTWAWLYPARKGWAGSMKSFTVASVIEKSWPQPAIVASPARYAESQFHGFSIEIAATGERQ